MATTSAIAIAAAFNSVDPRSFPYPRSAARADPASPNALSAPDQHDALLGRKLSPTPPHLANRVLYVPSHNDMVTHLPVYDFTAEFRATVGDEPIGSSRFKTSFGLMRKPIGDGRGASQVSYLIDFEPPEARSGVLAGPTRRKSSLAGNVVTRARVQRRMLGAGAEVGLTIPPHPAPAAATTDVQDGTVAFTVAPASTTVAIAATTTFPLLPTVTRFGSSRHPWFTFTVPSLLDAERTLQWQVHPVEHGMLRYTLVETSAGTASARDTGEGEGAIPCSAAQDRNEQHMRAIYHNVGLGFSLSQPFSEGALLLQNDLEPELEAIIVASLLGVLWRVRNEESRPRKSSKSEGSSSGGRPVRKTSVDDEAGGSTCGPTAQTSPTKRLFGKILGNKKE